MIRRSEFSICCCQPFGVQHRLGAASHELRSIGAEIGGQRIELFDQIVVELYEYLTSSHDHMVSHMAPARKRALTKGVHTARDRHVGGAFSLSEALSIAITDGGRPSTRS